MRILVFGATGRTGRRVVAAAKRRGLPCAAFVRDASRASDLGVDLHVGDTGVPADVAAAIRPDDVVVSCLGMSGDPASLSRGVGNVLAAMRKAGARRFVGVVGAGVLQHDATTRRNERPDYPPPLRTIGREHQAVYDALQAADLDWTLVCTPRILDGDPTGRMTAKPDYLPDGTGAVTTGEVAEAMLDAVAAGTPGRIGVNGS